MAGYSEAPLQKKLGIKEGFTLIVVNPPSQYFNLLGDLPAGVKKVSDKSKDVDFIHLFLKSLVELEKQLPKALKLLNQDGMIWVSWYKKSSGISTDVTEDLIRATAFPLGLVDIKVCAVDDQWSALKLVIRKENRR